jgi:sugar/nucleoside kinase (ribokinase family)
MVEQTLSKTGAAIKVGCAGILVADTFCGPLDALPREGELIAVDALPVSVGGCAANVSIGLARQGIAAEVVGCLGCDSAAQVVVASLERSGVNCERLSYADALPTSQTIVLLVKGQDRRFLHLFGANSAFTVTHIDRDWLRSLKVFYLGGLYVLSGIDLGALADVLRECRAHGVTTVVDVVTPGPGVDYSSLQQILPHTDYFLPNDDEAALITGQREAREQIRVLREWGAHTLVITQGAGGLMAAHGDDLWHADSFPVQAVDPSGGGDAFAAGLITGIARGWQLPDVLRYGSALGASATLAVGTTTSVFSAEEAERFLAAHPLAVRRE